LLIDMGAPSLPLVIKDEETGQIKEVLKARICLVHSTQQVVKLICEDDPDIDRALALLNEKPQPGWRPDLKYERCKPCTLNVLVKVDGKWQELETCESCTTESITKVLCPNDSAYMEALEKLSDDLGDGINSRFERCHSCSERLERIRLARMQGMMQQKLQMQLQKGKAMAVPQKKSG